MFLSGQAVDVACRHIQLVHTEIEVFQVVNKLAMTLGARRIETGTINAVHGVLLQLVRPSMSNVEACASTAASLSNFTKWKRLVHEPVPRTGVRPSTAYRGAPPRALLGRYRKDVRAERCGLR